MTWTIQHSELGGWSDEETGFTTRKKPTQFETKADAEKAIRFMITHGHWIEEADKISAEG